MHSTNHGLTWSALDKRPAPTPSNVMPAVAVTRAGVVYLSWYGSYNRDFRSSHAAWREMFAETSDPLAAHPRFIVGLVTGARPVHVGGIDTAGTVGADSGANWGLRDFQSIAADACGRPHLAWANDNGTKTTQTATGRAATRRACGRRR